jgi:two-component system CheB/CheR fusion protein
MATKTPARPKPTTRLCILIVDDEPEHADSLATIVKAWGHEAQAAYTGVAALKTALTYRPDVMLIDIGMPHLDGYQLAQEIRQQTELQATLLIAITGYSDSAHRTQAKQAGFDYYLVKPVNFQELQRLLQAGQSGSVEEQ